MEHFREESRIEEQKRAAAVAAREEAERKVAELETAVSAKAAALQAAEEESEAKAAAAAEQVGNADRGSWLTLSTAPKAKSFRALYQVQRICLTCQIRIDC